MWQSRLCRTPTPIPRSVARCHTPIPFLPPLSLCAAGGSDDAWSATMSAGAWANLDGLLKTAGVGPGGHIVGTNASSHIYQRRSIGAPWEDVPGALVQVDTKGEGLTIGVNSAGNMYKLQGGAWHNMPGAAKHASIGVDGTIFCVGNSDGNLYRWIGSTWAPVAHPSAGRVSIVAVGNARDVWTVSADSSIHRLAHDGASWQHIPGGLVQIAVSGSGRVLGVNAGHEIFLFHRGRNSWIKVPGAATWAAISDDHVVVINSADNIYHMALPSY